LARTVALLLDDPDNHYQQLLVQAARPAADRLGVSVLAPEFAGGSSWTQVESVNRLLRESRPDGALVMLAGGQWTRAPFERMVKAGVAVVLLNRVPDWVAGLRRDHPRALVASVAPRQEKVGEIQGHQALRLAGAGGFVLLVTGEAASPAVVARRRGFLEATAGRFAVHEVDGRWSVAGAEKAMGEWFRVGAERERPLALVVCQNDAMARGARAALARQAVDSGRPELLRTPLIGCDGLEPEGKAMVARGELAATVIMPPTTPSAVEVLGRYWDSGTPAGEVLLDASSCPALDALGPG
jgi:ABC-type sugar transport system substrate-binding protein